MYVLRLNFRCRLRTLKCFRNIIVKFKRLISSSTNCVVRKVEQKVVVQFNYDYLTQNVICTYVYFIYVYVYSHILAC